MKNVLLIIVSAFCANSVFAQSSVLDVPANHIKQGYDVPAPAKQIKAAGAVQIQQPVVVIDKNSSLYQAPVKAAASSQKVDQTGSLAPAAPAKTTAKNADSDGSVAPPVKKEEAKPVAKPTGAQSING